MVIIAVLAVLFSTISVTSVTQQHRQVYAYITSQSSSQANDCGNGELPASILCQNCDSQIQGNVNTLNLLCDQIAPFEELPKAELIVKKQVTCTDSTTQNRCQSITPSSFTLHVSGNRPNPDNFQGSGTGVLVSIGPGPYAVTEDPFPNAAPPLFSADCSGTIAAGDSKTCTVSNFVSFS